MSTTKPRIDWVDYSKGVCIILVVLMHSTLGVEKAAGGVSWLHGFIDWARPFRMPDFFFISGLFLASRIDRPWRDYLDKKLIHFGYFYLLWMTLQVLAHAPSILTEHGAAGLAQAWASGLVEPSGTLWFIYMLAVFFIGAKLLRNLNLALVLGAGAGLQMLHIDTGWLVIDEFAARFVYFYAGYVFAGAAFRLAARVDAKPALPMLAALTLWASANALAVFFGYAQLPGVGLALGFAGTAAVIAAGVLLAKTRLAAPLRYCGQNSIVIYLAFFLFMAAARVLLLRYAPHLNLSAIAILTTAAGVTGPLVLHRVTRSTRFGLLFQRPRWARLTPGGALEATRLAQRLARLGLSDTVHKTARSSPSQLVLTV